MLAVRPGGALYGQPDRKKSVFFTPFLKGALKLKKGILWEFFQNGGPPHPIANPQTFDAVLGAEH